MGAVWGAIAMGDSAVSVAGGTEVGAIGALGLSGAGLGAWLGAWLGA